MQRLGNRFRTTFVAMVALTVSTAAWAGGPLKGRILDKKTGEPLFGVTIQVEGTTNGTVTDFDGNYEIKVTPDAAYRVVVKYMGFQTQIIECGAKQTTLDVNREIYGLPDPDN